MRPITLVLLCISAVLCGLIFCVFYLMGNDMRLYEAASTREYTSLRDIERRDDTKLKESPSELIVNDETETHNDTRVPNISAFDASMREKNPHYTGWIKIEGTKVDYPMVVGVGNDYYLHTSFNGEENAYGTIYVDIESCKRYAPNILIYGHNLKSGKMFGDLRKYTDESFLRKNNIITIKSNDCIYEYEIFSAKKTDIFDNALRTGIETREEFEIFAQECGAPPGTKQIVTLITCISVNDKYGRMIVQGALRSDDED